MFTLSGFADEIDPDIKIQLGALNEWNIRYIELRGVNGRNITDLSLEETQQLKALLDREGIRVSAIGSPLGKIRITDPFEPHLRRFDHCIEQAKILKTQYIRMFSFYEAFDAREEVFRRLKIFIDHTPQGITLLHENEKDIYGNTIDRCLEIMEAFAPLGMRATFDPANFIQEDQDPAQAMKILQPYIAYVHVKDALFDSHKVVPAGHGDASWPLLLEKLREMHYDGFLSMEPHLADFAGYKALENSETALDLDKKDGKTMFAFALNELKTMLDPKEIS